MKDQFNEIIKSEGLKDISLDLVEKALDNKISDEVIWEILILNSLVAGVKIYNSYSDRILIKKQCMFYLNLGKLIGNSV